MIKGHWNRVAWVVSLALVGAAVAVSAQTAPAKSTATGAPEAARRLRITVKTPSGVRVICPVGRKGKEIVYQVEGADIGQVTLSADTVESADFDLKYDAELLQKAVRSMNWAQAAAILLPVVRPTLDYLDLKDNDAAPLALDAGMYLMKAAAVKTAGGLSSAAKERGTNEYAKAYSVLKVVAKTEWFTGAESARLRCVLCLFFLGKDEEARKELEAARTPDLGDAAYGLYWIATAHLHLASGDHAQAIEDAAQSLVFETKDLDSFPEALLLSARCYEELLEWHQARDVYYEVGRLFGGTHWRGFTTNRLDYVMAQGLTKSGEVSRVESVFFGSDEDLNAKSEGLLKALRENKEFTDGPKQTSREPKKKTPEKNEPTKDSKESTKEGAKSE